jgi:hypothetical protein
MLCRSITGRYRCSTDINEAIPLCCMLKQFYRRSSVAKFFADVLTMSWRCTDDVLPFLAMWYRCAAVLVPISENRQICAPVYLRRTKSARCDRPLRLYLLHDCTLDYSNDFSYKKSSFDSRHGREPAMTWRHGNVGRTVGFRAPRAIILH